MIKVLFLSLFVLSGQFLSAQSGLTGFADIGGNNVSDGLYIKAGTLGSFQFAENALGAGIQWDLLSNSERVITGLNISAQRNLSVKDFRFSLKGFYTWSGFSKLLRETNLGILAQHRWDHFEMQLGNSFRTYAYTRKAVDQYEPAESAPLNIHENWNLMYLFAYYLKPPDNPWNLGISVTSFDHFIISQETNPVVNLKGSVDIKPELLFFSEAWYQTSGALNLNVNYFGFFFRTGIIWKIE